MNVLLINCPVMLEEKPCFVPTGLMQISSALKHAGHHVTVYDLNALRSPREWVEEYLRTTVPDVDMVGISGIVTTFKYQIWLIQTLRAISSRVKIVCGGGCATLAGEMLERQGADAAIRGQGENALLRFLGDEMQFGHLDQIPFPDWEGIPLEIYLDNTSWGNQTRRPRNINVITSRGCPFDCRFCAGIFGRNFEQRSVENVIDEVKVLKQRFGIEFVSFVDDNMFVNRTWVRRFCEAIKDEGVLWACHARVNEVDEETLHAAYASGCRWIGFGVESGSQKILDAMQKRVTVAQADRAIRSTKDAGIFAAATLIFGYPGECKETVDETIDFCKRNEVKPNEIFHCAAYPGTWLYERFKDRILAKYGSYEGYLSRIDGTDARTFSLFNFTEMPDTEYHTLRAHLEASVA